VKKPTPIISPEQADQIRKARVGAVLKKLRDGKSITAAEQRLIEENTEKPKEKREKGRPREHLETLPVYGSMQACASATGIPLQVLKRSKKKGCPAFRATRVHLGELLPWLFAQGDDAAVGNWADALVEAKAKRERLKLEREKGEAIGRDLVKSAVQCGVSAVFAGLDKRFVNELPPVLKGLDELAIRDRVRTSIEKLKADLRVEFARIEEIKEENADE